MLKFEIGRFGPWRLPRLEAWWPVLLGLATLVVLIFGINEIDRRVRESATTDARARAGLAATLLTSAIDDATATASTTIAVADAALRDIDDPAEIHRILEKLPLADGVLKITAADASGRPVASNRDIRASAGLRKPIPLIVNAYFDGIYLSHSEKNPVSGIETIKFIRGFRFPDGTTRRIYTVSYSLERVLRLFDAIALTPKSINVIGNDGRLRIAVQRDSQGSIRHLSDDVVLASPIRRNSDETAQSRVPSVHVDDRIRRAFASSPSRHYGLSVVVDLDLNEKSGNYKDMRNGMLVTLIITISALTIIGFVAYVLRERHVRARALEALRRNESEILRSIAKLDNLAIATVSFAGNFTTVAGSNSNEISRYIEENWRSILSQNESNSDEPSIHRFQDATTNSWREIAVVTNHASAPEQRAQKILLALDLTHIRQKANKLYQLSKLAAIGGLSTAIAHEIHQPLGTIWFAIHNARPLLKKGEVSAVELKFDLIESQIKKIKKYVDHLRQFGRPSTQIEPHHEIDIVQVVQAATELLGIENETHPSPISVHVCPEAGRYFILGDPNSLEQVIINLIQNARYSIKQKWASEAPERGKIEIMISAAGTDNIIQISDNGGGIPPEILPHIFELFFTTKPIEDGTGLGLAISQDIIRELGGVIAATNTDEGAMFTIKLPKSDLTPILPA
ncbi:sensor histidine kinase [Undibacter mobilis]|uniref:histidine kinase n=1 Tax=Undibacter mobilis TaxID=2292256 RepID=A0A371B9B4_9BRAD|nr:ATP-binding protein [Undibacter mobilis]RDV04013.1 hypothetical protein DXH78_05080 [Undibacter mobilis]